MLLYPEIVLIVLAFIWIVFASIQDWRTKEVSDWLNASLLIFALLFRFLYSLFSNSWNFFRISYLSSRVTRVTPRLPSLRCEVLIPPLSRPLFPRASARGNIFLSATPPTLPLRYHPAA